MRAGDKPGTQSGTSAVDTGSPQSLPRPSTDPSDWFSPGCPGASAQGFGFSRGPKDKAKRAKASMICRFVDS